jgi:hypothetical protein
MIPGDKAHLLPRPDFPSGKNRLRDRFYARMARTSWVAFVCGGGWLDFAGKLAGIRCHRADRNEITTA